MQFPWDAASPSVHAFWKLLTDLQRRYQTPFSGTCLYTEAVYHRQQATAILRKAPCTTDYSGTWPEMAEWAVLLPWRWRENLFQNILKTINNQELLCRGWFLPSNTYDCDSFVVNWKAVIGKDLKVQIIAENQHKKKKFLMKSIFEEMGDTYRQEGEHYP